jgi:hypothetical protein
MAGVITASIKTKVNKKPRSFGWRLLTFEAHVGEAREIVVF